MNGSLIFLDVDDTLYSKSQRLVPPSAIEGIKEAQKNGHKVLINTGRPFAYFEKEILDIGFDGLLCSNGVHIILDGETVYSRTVPEDTMHFVMESCENNGIFGVLEGRRCSFFRDHNIDFHPHYGFMIQAFDLAPYMPHKFSWDQADECDKMIVFAGEGSNVPGFLKDLDSISEVMDYIRIDDTQYEILLKGHDKGTGLVFTADHYNVPLDRCYAFGDSNNDTEMILRAGHGVAMGNACDELKENVEFVTTHVDQDGIYNGLKHYGLI